MENSLQGATDQINEQVKEVDLSELGMQLTDVVVSSGVIEQFGTELGVSGAVIAALVGIYWKARGGKPKEEESSDDIKEPSSADKIAVEEVEKLKTIEEQQIDSGNKDEKSN